MTSNTIMHVSHSSFFQQCNAFHIVDSTLYVLYHCYAYVIAYMYLTEHKEVFFGKIKSDIFSNGRALLLFQCWASVEDSGPTLKPHWVNAPYFRAVWTIRVRNYYPLYPDGLELLIQRQWCWFNVESMSCARWVWIIIEISYICTPTNNMEDDPE